MDLFETLVGFLKGAVGNNMGNAPEDVLTVKRGLSHAGYYDMDRAPEPHGYLTKAMDESVRNFQKDNNLRVDGTLLPGGETERSLYEVATGRSADEAFGRTQNKNTEKVGFGGNITGTIARIATPQRELLRASQAQPATRTGITRSARDLSEDDALPAGSFGHPAQNVDATGRAIREENITPPSENRLMLRPPIPGRKPVQSSIPTMDELPEFRRYVFQDKRRDDWKYWTETNAKDSELNDDMKYALNTTFAAEGGFDIAPQNRAYAGITKTSLADAIARVEDDEAMQTIARKYGHAPDPEQLSHEEIHQTYKSVLDAAMKSATITKNKRAIQLLGELGDRKITAAVTDTLFRNGSGEGAFLIQRAINATRSPRNRIAEYGGFGSKTYDALKEVAENPRKHRIFLDTLSDERMTAKSYDPAEKERMLFYRFPGWKPEEEKQ